MRLRQVLTALVCALGLLPAVLRAQSPPPFAKPGPCQEGRLPSGARSLVCVPTDGWNGGLVVFAHGYVPPGSPLTFADLELPDGTDLRELIQQLGFAFATTTYRENGLAVLEGVEDIAELVDAWPTQQFAPPDRTYLTGVSEGGLVAALAAERYPERFTAAYAVCGPLGNFLFQINYVADFRALFDAYFPGLLPGTAVDVPAALRTAWDARFVPDIKAALAREPARARELLRVARAPFNPADDTTVVDTTIGLLWHNVAGANEMRARLFGNPYSNRLRWYSGSSNDLLLNLRIKRYDADAPALIEAGRYAPAGDLRIPLVTLHTTGDELVPYAHELIYAAKLQPTGRGRLLPLPVLRYGHCSFATSEILTGFALMLGAGVTSAPAPLAPVADAVEERASLLPLDLRPLER
jgi:pimeloyl-ACP methyl ester carboxylesterase